MTTDAPLEALQPTLPSLSFGIALEIEVTAEVRTC
jgi:hypothetical protein